jgi:thiamine-monophosphate kinase
MGGEPRWALVSCGLPKGLAVRYADGIYSGLKKAAGRFGVNIVGGDTNASDKIILDVTVLGEVKKEDLVLRSGARVGDLIFVTGELGGSIRGKHLDFTPRIKESQILVKDFKINSMIDLSDGLSSDLNHILEQSAAGAIIYEYLIPRSPHPAPSPHRGEGRGEGGYCSVENALSDGEDFELLFTMSKKEGFKLLRAKERLFDIPVTRIGTVTEKAFGAKIADIFGRRRELRPAGFRHF